MKRCFWWLPFVLVFLCLVSVGGIFAGKHKNHVHKIDAFRGLETLDKYYEYLLLDREPMKSLRSSLTLFHQYIFGPFESLLGLFYIYTLLICEIILGKNAPVLLSVFFCLFFTGGLLYYRTCQSELKPRPNVYYFIHLMAGPSEDLAVYQEHPVLLGLRFFHLYMMLFLGVKDFYNASLCNAVFQGVSQLGDHFCIAIICSFAVAYLPSFAYSIAYCSFWKVVFKFVVSSPYSPFAVQLEKRALRYHKIIAQRKR